MKRFLKIAAWVVGILLIVVLGFAAFINFRGIPSYDPPKVDLAVEVTPERVAHGERLSAVLCTECHRSDKERKLSGKLLVDIPKEFGTVYSKNITNDPEIGIGNWTDGQIYGLLRTGIHKNGQYLPPYMPKFPLMSDEDIHSIIAFLRSDRPLVQASQLESPDCQPSFLVKLLSQFAFKPYALPEKTIFVPDTTDLVAHGEYLVHGRLACFGCHSADFKTVNELEPTKSVGYLAGGNPLLNYEGEVVRSANITIDKETGIGSWTEEQFITAMKTGQTPNGPYYYPMLPYNVLDTLEVRAIWAYLNTVPPVKNAVERYPKSF